MKKKLAALVLTAVMAIGCLAGCGQNGGSGTGWTEVQHFTYQDIASWVSMQTPSEGSGSGTVEGTNDTDGYVTIHAANDGWGGVESAYFDIDLSKDPVIFAKIFENPDGFNWCMKIVPENPIEDHEWGCYVIPDNNLKWNKYAGADLNEALGEEFKEIYGEQCRIKIWISAAGGPDAVVSVSEIFVMNTK